MATDDSNDLTYLTTLIDEFSEYNRVWKKLTRGFSMKLDMRYVDNFVTLHAEYIISNDSKDEESPYVSGEMTFPKFNVTKAEDVDSLIQYLTLLLYGDLV